MTSRNRMVPTGTVARIPIHLRGHRRGPILTGCIHAKSGEVRCCLGEIKSSTEAALKLLTSSKAKSKSKDTKEAILILSNILSGVEDAMAAHVEMLNIM